MLTRLRNYLADNPYEQLLSTAWHYARGLLRGRYLVIYVMFTGVNRGRPV